MALGEARYLVIYGICCELKVQRKERNMVEVMGSLERKSPRA